MKKLVKKISSQNLFPIKSYVVFNFTKTWQKLRDKSMRDKIRDKSYSAEIWYLWFSFLGNPDNNIDDNCMVLNLSNGQWYSHNCYDILPYICDFSQPTTTCSPCQSHCEMPCPDSWVYNSTLGFCYKVKKFSLNITCVPPKGGSSSVSYCGLA